MAYPKSPMPTLQLKVWAQLYITSYFEAKNITLLNFCIVFLLIIAGTTDCCELLIYTWSDLLASFSGTSADNLN